MMEFDPEGRILSANQSFLNVVGYSREEVVGRHHRLFVEPTDVARPTYEAFWRSLRNGEVQVSEFKQITKAGEEVWIKASYNPVINKSGKCIRVVKVATNITSRKREYADFAGQIAAIDRSQAVIEFGVDGTIRSANANFLNALGYTLAEIVGRHHSIFVHPVDQKSEEYAAFWAGLRAGNFQSGQFKRIGKNGNEVWIEASYNPILDPDGKPFKIVKIASDITKQVILLSKLKSVVDSKFGEIDDALSHSQSQADVASDTMNSTSQTVQTMAASAEELAASVREISGTMVRSKVAVEFASSQVSAANVALETLGTLSKSMSGIVTVIREIAGQINLLALNATIEAARAGDAGRGFSVVAGEVKNLAHQASNATQRIAAEISGLQSVSDNAISALGGISSAMEEVLRYTAGTASAVEEQSVVTQELSLAMQQTASSVAGVNDNMNEIKHAAVEVGKAVGETREATRVLMR